uniref:Nuclear FMR1 interacting protein 1 n=1 Tax=Cyprinus carpio TaxID=7962 RepID=A0A8C2BDQ2_CYPCA
MTGEHERYPPPNFSAAAEPPAARHWSGSTLQSSRRFEASRDWSWTQPVPSAHGTVMCIWTGAAGALHHRYPPPPHQGWRGSAQHHWGRKREPEFSHFCDTCDRGFKTRDKYDEHISQHVKCSVEDCLFSAHEKLVKIHWRNNHAPGAKRIKLDTAEDIARWRAERRRNYPTLRNVEKKLKLMEVKEQRGDVLETAQFRCRNLHRSSSTDLKRPHQDSDPLAALVCSDPESDKDESVQETQTGLTVAPKSVTSALGSLMSSYGDDMTSSESEADTDGMSLVLMMFRARCRHYSSYQSQIKNNYSKYKYPDTNTALCDISLLAPDIRHERNVVLQCVRFIVRCGFFGLAAKDSHEISVSVNTNPERASDPQICQSQEPGCDTSAGENTRVKESPERRSVFQQLFAQQLVCDEAEETHS